MDNQQERSIVTPEFLAGLIVGEGSYYLTAVKRSNRPWAFRPTFSLSMNDLETSDMVCESFKTYGLALYRQQKPHNGCARLIVSGILRMRSHLDFFLPLLTGKKLQAAEIVSEFVNYRLSLPPTAKYTEKDVDFVARVRAVNGLSGPRVPIEILRDYTRKADRRLSVKI